MNDFWNHPSLKAFLTATEYMKFGAVGDSIEGTIAKLELRFFPGQEQPAIEVVFEEQGIPVLTVGQKLLKTALVDMKPEEGDYMAVTLVALTPCPAGNLMHFRVEVTYCDGTADVIDQTPQEPSRAGRRRGTDESLGGGTPRPSRGRQRVVEQVG